jgi:hypothetical protein
LVCARYEYNSEHWWAGASILLLKNIRNEGAQRCVEVALESPSPGLRKT